MTRASLFMPSDLDQPRLEALSRNAWPGLQVHWRESAGSTHADAKAWLGSGEKKPPFLIAADFQSAGVGRRGNAWEAPPGTSLLLTLGLPWSPEAFRERLGPTLAAALAAAEALDAFLPAPASIKWPNDVHAEGRKLGGAIADVVSKGGKQALALSVGLNVSQTAEQLPPPGEGTAATSVRMERERAGLSPLGEDARPKLLESLLRFLRSELDARESEALPRLRSRLSTMGKAVRIEREGQAPLIGEASSLDAEGALTVRRADGTSERCFSGHLREIGPGA